MRQIAAPHRRIVRMLLAVLATFSLFTLACSSDRERLNVLFFLTEDHGPQLSFVGTPGLSTPNIDSLAETGTYFQKAFVVYPVCSPSKAALYTGLYSHANGVMQNVGGAFEPASDMSVEDFNAPSQGRTVHENVPTLIEILRGAGYYTGITRKLQVFPVERFPYDELIPRPALKPVAGFIRRAKRTGKPWFLMSTIGSTHRPFPNSDEQDTGVDPRAVEVPSFLPDTPIVRKDWSEYLAAIELADQQIADAMTALEESGEAERTIIVLMGDHGPAFQRGKMSLHDFGVHVPLIIVAPNRGEPSISEAVVTELDVMPTLLDLLGLEPPALQHGRSLRSELAGTPSPRNPEFAFAEMAHPLPQVAMGMQERAVYDGRYRLILRKKVARPRRFPRDLRDWEKWRNRTYAETVRMRRQFPQQYQLLREQDPARLGGHPPKLELFDTQSDPYEMTNLAGDPAFETTVLRLSAALEKWAVATGDPYTEGTRATATPQNRD